jgi:hypothetical protein
MFSMRHQDGHDAEVTVEIRSIPAEVSVVFRDSFILTEINRDETELVPGHFHRPRTAPAAG